MRWWSSRDQETAGFWDLTCYPSHEQGKGKVLQDLNQATRSGRPFTSRSEWDALRVRLGGSGSFVLTFLTLGKWRPGVPFLFRCCILQAETRFSLANESVDPESLDFTGFKMIRNNIFVILNFPRLNYSVILARTTLSTRTTSELQLAWHQRSWSWKMH